MGGVERLRPDPKAEDFRYMYPFDKWGVLRDSKSRGFPLQSRSRGGMAKPAILALRGMQPHGQITIGEIDQHAEVVTLDAIRDCL